MTKCDYYFIFSKRKINIRVMLFEQLFFMEFNAKLKIRVDPKKNSGGPSKLVVIIIMVKYVFGSYKYINFMF